MASANDLLQHSGEPEMVAATDATWEQFMRGCIAAPQNCALARNHHTFQDLESAMRRLFDTFRNNPPVYNGSLVFELSFLESHVYNALYSPSKWPQLATSLDGLLRGDLEPIVASISEGGAIPSQAQAILGIRCGDKKLRTDKLADLGADLNQYRRTSRWFWDWGWGYYVMPCAQWKFHAKERYNGDFRVKTKNPMLIVGNTYDPVTPLVSARNMSEGFEGSVLLTHNGHGVSILSFPLFSTEMMYVETQERRDANDSRALYSTLPCLNRPTVRTRPFSDTSSRAHCPTPEPCASLTSRCSILLLRSMSISRDVPIIYTAMSHFRFAGPIMAPCCIINFIE